MAISQSVQFTKKNREWWFALMNANNTTDFHKKKTSMCIRCCECFIHETIHCKCKFKCWLNREFQNKLKPYYGRIDRKQTLFLIFKEMREFYRSILYKKTNYVKQTFCEVWAIDMTRISYKYDSYHMKNANNTDQKLSKHNIDSFGQ